MIKKLLILCLVSLFSLTLTAGGLKSDTIDVVNYSLHLNIMNFSAKQLSGHAILTLTPKMAGITHIPLDLIDLTVDSVKVNGTSVPAWYRDNLTLRIPLASAISPGDTIQVRVVYHGQPNIEPYGWGGFHFKSWIAYNLGVAFVADPHNYGRAWFPCVDDFIDRATYDYFITTEPDKMAVCGGVLLGSFVNPDNTITWQWRMNQTIPAYLASVAVAGYTEISDVYNGIAGDVPILLYFRPSDTVAVNTLFVNLKEIMAIYEAHWGPYPFERVGFTGTIEGAMEHACNVAYPVSTLSPNYEWLYAHELAHMWFGDMVTCSTPEDMWLNEGWAVFNESLFREGLYGYPAYRTNMNSKHASVLQFCHVKDQGYRALYGIPNAYTYGETVYQKGGIVVHALRNYLGDSLFFPAIQDFLSGYAFQPVSSFQLRDYLTAHTGVNMDGFFDGWVFAPGFPGFVIDSFSVVPVGNEYQATAYVHQKLKGAPQFVDQNRLFVSFIDSNWEAHEYLMEFSGEYGSQGFILPFEPLLCFADYNDKITDATTDYDLRIRQAGDFDFPNTFFRLTVSNLTDSAFFRVTHNWTPPDDLKTPRPGLTLSDYRYWRIEAIYDQPFRGKGRFFYSKPSALDVTLLQNPNDSLVILYRRDASDDWKGVAFTRTGSITGYIWVDYLQPGEYTLAVWDELYVGTKPQIQSSESRLSVSPNPVRGRCNITVNSAQGGVLSIHSPVGQLLLSKALSAGRHEVDWQAAHLPAGIYMARWRMMPGDQVESLKIIVP